MKRSKIFIIIICSIYCFILLFLIGCSKNDTSRLPSVSLSFYGAAQTVDGACFLLEVDELRLLVDCGIFYEIEGNTTVPALPQDIDAVLLTHVHLDHWGRFPSLLLKEQENITCYATVITTRLMTDKTHGVLANNLDFLQIDLGKERFIYSNRACKNAKAQNKLCIVHAATGAGICEWWVKGSERVGNTWSELWCNRQELEELGFRLCYSCKKGEDLLLEGAYDTFISRNLDEEWNISPGVTARFLNAGHIPGSAMILIEVSRDDGPFRILFSGDLGSGHHPLLPDWEIPLESVDVLITESTYGMKKRIPYEQELRRFFSELNSALSMGKRIVIPSFALDRAQRLLYHLGQGKELGIISNNIPIYLCGSSIQDYTALYAEIAKEGAESYADYFTIEFFDSVSRFNVSQSMSLPFCYQQILSLSKKKPIPEGPCILITTSADGQYSVARELLCRLVTDLQTEFFIVAYADKKSPVGQLVKGLHSKTSVLLNMECFKEPISVAADRIHSYKCFSGHTTGSRILELLERVSDNGTVFVVHGSSTSSRDLGNAIEHKSPNVKVIIPQLETNPRPYVLY